MAKHHLTHASQLYYGGGYHAGIWNDNRRNGAEITPIVKVDLGAPITLDVNGLVVAATSTELPDTETVTYTFATDGGASPLDGANTDGVLDAPRNVTSVTSHGSSVVAMTILVTGTDTYNEVMSELLTVPATGTSQAVAGTKAFKTVTSIAITAAADAEANTLNMGWGDVLGLPYNLEGEYDVLAQYADTTEEKLASVWAAADATDPATTTTDDVRGTVDPNTACDGSVNYIVWMKVADPSTKVGLGGVTQA